MEDLLRLVSQAAKQNIDWMGIENALSSFVIPMSQTEQNPVFHAEGDVWTHTKMVCEELVRLDSFRQLVEEKKQPFVWNATNITPMTRQRQIALFSAYDASVHVVYLETDWNEQLHRNADRVDSAPEQAICDMLEKLSPPERSEAHGVEWHCI